MANESVSTSTTRDACTVPVIFQQDPNSSDGVLEYVTPTTAAAIKLMDKLSDSQRHEVLRVAQAIKAGIFNHSAAEIKAWTPAQRRLVVDSLPEVQA